MQYNMMQQQSDAELARKLGDEESKNYAELANNQSDAELASKLQ